MYNFGQYASYVGEAFDGMFDSARRAINSRLESRLVFVTSTPLRDISAHINYMSGKKKRGHPGKKVGKPNHKKRVSHGVSLPGYDPSGETSLKAFLRANYRLSGSDLGKVLKCFNMGQNGRAQKLLKGKRK